MTTEIDVLNAQITDAQAQIVSEQKKAAQLQTASDLKIVKLNKNITDWQDQITQITADAAASEG